MEKIPMDDIKKELKSLQLSGAAIEELLRVLHMKSLTELEEKLGDAGEAVADLKQLFSLAEKFGFSEWIQFDASIVRGLAYYTGIVFEGFDRGGKLRAICGGGRYDHLLATFGGDDIPACGFGFGDAVIVELLKDKGLLPALNHCIENIVCSLDHDLRGAAATVATVLRQKGQSVDLVLENKPLKWVFKRAARINARRLILVGSSEWQRGMVCVKILESGEQYEVKIDDME
ncbi:Histidine--tRNA ligase [Bertholletia excelsa]